MSVSASGVAAARPTEEQSRKAIYAATIGNVMEWYDFGVFGFLAGSLALNFFPRDDPRTSLLNTFLIFGVGLVFRPLGGIVIGRMGDRRGRKPALILTILMMAVGTVIIGVLPTYSSIGVMAPILLLLARLLQGFSTGGEWGGATAFMAEWSVEGKRGLYTSFQQMSVAGGTLLGVGLAALLTSVIGTDAINDWGWRIPFLLGGLFGPIGLWLRREVDETPPYREVVSEGEAAEASTLGHAAQAFGFTILWTVAFYVFLTYMPTYTRTQLHLTAAQSLWASTVKPGCAGGSDSADGRIVGPDRPETTVAGILRAVFRAADPGVLCADAGLRVCQRAVDPDHILLRDFVVFGTWTGGDRGDLPDARPVDLDVVVLCAGSGDLRGIRAVYLAVADRHDRIEDGADRLCDGGRGGQLPHHRPAAGNGTQTVAIKDTNSWAKMCRSCCRATWRKKRRWSRDGCRPC